MIARLRRAFTQERVTLLIEEETARLLTVQSGRVVRWGSAPIARGAIVDGRIVEAGAVAAAVTRLWELHGPPREAVILGVPGVGVATRLLRVPRQARLTEEEVLEAAARSLDIDGTYLAW
ncbi:MAG TPA: hypothetical protein VER55_03620, partial [Ardenticatenaceae bacterium]|nr:hypothetical protein [Ardenticatenaceae bacterium]